MHLTQVVGRNDIGRELEAIGRSAEGRSQDLTTMKVKSQFDFAVCNGETERPSQSVTFAKGHEIHYSCNFVANRSKNQFEFRSPRDPTRETFARRILFIFN